MEFRISYGNRANSMARIITLDYDYPTCDWACVVVEPGEATRHEISTLPCIDIACCLCPGKTHASCTGTELTMEGAAVCVS